MTDSDQSDATVAVAAAVASDGRERKFSPPRAHITPSTHAPPSVVAQTHTHTQSVHRFKCEKTSYQHTHTYGLALLVACGGMVHVTQQTHTRDSLRQSHIMHYLCSTVKAAVWIRFVTFLHYEKSVTRRRIRVQCGAHTHTHTEYQHIARVCVSRWYRMEI